MENFLSNKEITVFLGSRKLDMDMIQLVESEIRETEEKIIKHEEIRKEFQEQFIREEKML